MPRQLRRDVATVAIAAIAAGLLSSCATPGANQGLGLPPGARSSEKPAPYDPFGFGKAETPKPDAGQTAATDDGANTIAKTRMAAVAPAQTPTPPSSALDNGTTSQSSFAGISGDELKARWGVPSLMRTEAGAALWQFQGKGCVVLAYLYPGARGGMETSYAEARPGGDSAAAVNACLGKGAHTKDVSLTPASARQPALMLKPN